MHYQKSTKYKENQKTDSICRLLKKMLADDYLYRNDENRPTWDSLGLTDSIISSKGRIVDSININLLMCIIHDYGWPTYDVFGFEASENAFIIAQHADEYLNLQRKCLKHIEQEFLRYRTSLKHYAYLLDRISVNSSKKQYFGTQFRRNEKLNLLEYGGSLYEYEVVPLVNPEKVHIYRAICNLPSLEEYKAIHRQKTRGAKDE